MTLARRLRVLEAAAPPPAPTRPHLPDDPVVFAQGLLAGAFGPVDLDPGHPHHTGWLCRMAAFLGTLGAEHQAWLRGVRELNPRA